MPISLANRIARCGDICKAVRSHHSSFEASNDRGAKGVTGKKTQMEIRKLDTETGNRRIRRDFQGDSKSKLALIAVRPRKEPKAKFSNLMHHLNKGLIAEGLQSILKDSSVGVDKMTVGQAQANLSWILPHVLKHLHEGTYQTPPVRRAYIPKVDGSKRLLGVPKVIDHVVQKGMAEILNQIYEQDFLVCSAGFRPGIGCHHALATVEYGIYK